MPYFGPLPDTLLVDGQDVQLLPGIVVDDLSGLFAPGTRRGDNVVIPGRRGVIGVPKVYDAYEFTIGVTVLGETATQLAPATPHERRALMLTNLAALGTYLDGDGGLLTLTRRFAAAGGGYNDHTCSGEFIDGLQAELLNVETGRTELQFVNHDGAWWTGAAWVVP